MTDHQPRAEILWDRWGVPHVYAEDDPGVYRGFGWAQMRDHGDLLLRLYGRARGRAAEYWGEGELPFDTLVHSFGFPQMAGEWYAAQSPAMAANLDAFTAGLNDAAVAYADRLSEDAKRALPVRTADVIGHVIRVLYHFFELSGKRFAPFDTPGLAVVPGSNAWAIGPAKSASGNAMLLGNPHLNWSDLYLFYEAHLVAPDLDVYGCTLVGWPMLVIAFNDHVGWTHTVNFFDGYDAYRLTPTEDGKGYIFNGEPRAYDTREVTLRVRTDDGGLRDEPFTVRRSVHGPVITEVEGAPVAIRTVGVDVTQVPGIFQQYLDMARAGSLAELDAALSRLQMPMFTAVAADSGGHIMHLFGGHVPLRPSGDWDFWNGLVPGDSDATLWHDIHPYADLPKVVDPPTGWVQNANCPPWTATWPQALFPADYPAYMSGRFLSYRERSSLRMLLESGQLTLEEMIRLKHSTRMELAVRLKPQIIAAARAQGGERLLRAADVLEAWDGYANPDSRGAFLFQRWLETLEPNGDFLPHFTPATFDDADPLGAVPALANVPAALAALEAAVAAMDEAGQALDIPWGEQNRFRIGAVDLPGQGAQGDPHGAFRNMRFLPDSDGRNKAVGGDTFVLAVEFGPTTEAWAVLGYGNSSRYGVVCDVGQLHLLSAGRLRPVLRARAEVEGHLTGRDTV